MMKARLFAISLLLSLATSALAADKLDANVLDRWVGGKWVGDGALVDSDFSKSMKLSGVTTCAWSPDHVFVICDQAVHVNNKPARQLSLYGYDPEAGKFRFYGLSPSEEKPRTPDLLISDGGSRWEYVNSDDIKGKSVRFRTVNIFHDADHVEWWTEYSNDDGAHWTRMGSGKEARQQ